MLSASFYIAFCTARNRLRVRLRRLREPRYLLGAIVATAYLYFAVLAPRRRPGIRPGRGQPAAFPPLFQIAGASLAGLGVFLLAVLAWFIPTRSGLLDFSDAETEFLFPAPVSRRQLLAHRVIRSQVGSLIASAFIAIFATPVAILARVQVAVGFWALLVTIRLYYAAVTLTRARLQSPIAAVRRVAWVPIGLLAAATAVVGVNVTRVLNQPAAGPADLMVQLSRATAMGLPHLILWPFIAVLRPPFADPASFFPAMAASLVVLCAVTAWMLLSDATFDDVAGKGSRGRDAVESGATARPSRARNVGWTLPLTGRADAALLWKGAMETIRGISGKTWRYAAPIVFAIGGVSFGIIASNGLRGPASAISIVAAIIAVAATIFGPQVTNSDLCTDYQHLEVLKTWPVRAADVIRGEMAWPVLLVSATACGGLLVAALFSGTALPRMPFVSRWSFSIAAVFVAPALIAAQYAVHSAVTIFFPAWVQTGSQRTRGFDAMGQRLIMLAAIVVSLVVFALPGALAGGVVWLLLHRLAGDIAYVPSAIVFALVVFVEVLAVTEALGPAYERIDVTSVERGE